jgi:hypothetical protein
MYYDTRNICKNNFGLALEINHQVEMECARLLAMRANNMGGKAKILNISYSPFSLKEDYDIKIVSQLGESIKETTIEIKNDIESFFTKNVAFETFSRGKESGIQRTNADFWMHILRYDRRIFIMIQKTDLLRKYIKKYAFAHLEGKGDENSLTKFSLIHIEDVFKHEIMRPIISIDNEENTESFLLAKEKSINIEFLF